MAQLKQIWLRTMRLQVWSLASLSGLSIWRCMSCGVGCRRVSDLALLWLWCRLAGTAPIRPPAWEPPYAVSAALKRQKKKKKSVQTWADTVHNNEFITFYFHLLNKLFFITSWLSKSCWKCVNRGVNQWSLSAGSYRALINNCCRLLSNWQFLMILKAAPMQKFYREMTSPWCAP